MRTTDTVQHELYMMYHHIDSIHIANNHKYFCYVKYNGTCSYKNYSMNTDNYSVPITNMIIEYNAHSSLYISNSYVQCYGNMTVSIFSLLNFWIV